MKFQVTLAESASEHGDVAVREYDAENAQAAYDAAAKDGYVMDVASETDPYAFAEVNCWQ